MTSLRKIFFCIIALFCVADLSAQSTETLNVMTYNIKGHGMTDSRLADIAKVINQQSPDIVALQEVDNRTFLGLKHNYLEELAEATGMNYEFFPLVGTYYGIGLLSKEKPLSVDTHRVERGANSTDKEDRGFIIAEFNDFFFMSTHYSLNADDRDVATDWAVDFALNSDKTVFIAGDFNAKPTYRAIVTFKNNGFKILNDINEYTYPAEAPESCIDMLLCYSNFREAVKYDVTDSYIAETEGLELPDVSDHLPVMIKLAKKASSATAVENDDIRLSTTATGFRLSGLTESVPVTVYDLYGKAILAAQVANEQNVDMPQNSMSSIYFIQVGTHKQKHTYKFFFY